MSDCNEKELLAEAAYVRRLAVVGTTVACVATVIAALAIPMLYSYSIHVQSSLQEELAFCQSRTSNLFGEFDRVSILLYYYYINYKKIFFPFLV